MEWAETGTDSKHSMPLETWTYVLTAGLAGVAEVLWTTQWGIPVSPDGLVYLSSAQSFADGFGFRIHPQPDGALLHHYPPFYPFLLGLLILSGLDLNTAPIFLNAVLFFLFPVSLGWILYRLTASSLVAAATAWAGWVIPGFYQSFAFPWTEPLYLVTSLWGIYFLARYLTGTGIGFLFAAGIILGLAWLSRYAGASLWITGVIALLLFSKQPWKLRVLSTTVFALLAGSPMGFWLIRNWVLIGTPTDRIAAFHPPGVGRIFELILTLHPLLAAGPGGFPSYRSLWFALFVLGGGLFLRDLFSHRTGQKTTHRERRTFYGISLTVLFLGLILSFNLENPDPISSLTRVVLGRETSLFFLETLPVLLVLVFFLVSLWWGLSYSQIHSAQPGTVRCFIRLNFLYATVFLLLLIVSLIWFDPFTRFLPRLISPLVLVGVILLALSLIRLHAVSKEDHHPAMMFRPLLSAAFLILLFSWVNQKSDWLQHALYTGHGELTREWRAEEYHPLSVAGPNQPEIFSNFPVAYYLLTGKRIRFGTLADTPLKSHSGSVLYIHLKLFNMEIEKVPPHSWRRIYDDEFLAWYSIFQPQQTSQLSR